MKQLLKEKLLVLDGAMGTQLQPYTDGNPGDLLNLTKPEVVQAVHASYLAKGSDLILTNTFGANQVRLEKFGLRDRLWEINQAAVANARKAGAKWVVGSIGPTGEMSAPMGSFTFADFYQAFHPQIKALLAGGVDMLAVETMLDVIELKAAVAAVRDLAPEIPLIAQVSLLNGRTLNGTDLPGVAIMLDAMGVDVIGLNCVTLSEDLPAILKAAAKVTDKPLILQANAGLPDEHGCHHLDLAEWRRIMKQVVATPGMGIVGGCCGTNPEAIGVLRELVDEVGGLRRPADKKPAEREITYLASRTGILAIERSHGLYVIGERINPTGRVDLQKALETEDWYTISDEGTAQVEAGAVMLDVNVGHHTIDQPRAMAEVVQQLQMVTNVPLLLDSPDPAVLEAGLKVYIGKPVINSCTGSEESLQTILPLAKKYGAAVIGLCMDEIGVPSKMDYRVKMGLHIVKTAEKLGIKQSDIWLDPLILSAVTGEGSAATLQTVQALRKEAKVKLIGGLSNVSYGLPDRELLNRTFAAMAIFCGLDLAIANPQDKELWKTIHAAKLLLGNDPDCRGYLEFYRQK